MDSCLDYDDNHRIDKITIYDGNLPNKSSIIDVICTSSIAHRQIISSGHNLLIEFESSTNQTSNGFSAIYRFIGENHHTTVQGKP